jgi:hypothetical protein
VQADENLLHVSLDAEARSDLAALLGRERFSSGFTASPDPSKSVLSIGGDIVLQFADDDSARPYVVLKAKLTLAHAAVPSWTMRYVSSIGPARELEGEHGWAPDGAASLRANLSAALERALVVMLTDVSSPFARDPDGKIAVTGDYPFLRRRLQVVGYYLAEERD